MKTRRTAIIYIALAFALSFAIVGLLTLFGVFNGCTPEQSYEPLHNQDESQEIIDGQH